VVDDQRLYRNEKEFWYEFKWLSGDIRGACIQLRGAGGLDEEIVREGPWGIFRLFESADKMTAVKDDDSQFLVTWTMSAPPVSVTMQVRPRRGNHPFPLSFFRNTNCPPSIGDKFGGDRRSSCLSSRSCWCSLPVPFWRKRRRRVRPRSAASGKLPATGDFIRHNAGGEELARRSLARRVDGLRPAQPRSGLRTDLPASGRAVHLSRRHEGRGRAVAWPRRGLGAATTPAGLPGVVCASYDYGQCRPGGCAPTPGRS
jgi:hypothetical protein